MKTNERPNIIPALIDGSDIDICEIGDHLTWERIDNLLKRGLARPVEMHNGIVYSVQFFGKTFRQVNNRALSWERIA